MSKDTSGEYKNQRRIINATILGLGAISAYATAKAADAGTNFAHQVSNNIRLANATVDVPPAGGEYKTFYVGETFKVGDKIATVDSLSTAAKLAKLPGVLPSATQAMLDSQLPDGMQANQIPDTIEFKLPVSAEIGDLHTGE